MPFQFLCPQGHLLLGDETQVGQQCQCPHCGTPLVIPSPSPPPSEPFGQQQVPQQQVPQQQVPQQQVPQQPYPQQQDAQAQPQEHAAASEEDRPTFPGIQTVSDLPGGVSAPQDTPSADELPGGAAQTVVHVCCPAGHELETPRDMLGQDAMCPFCQKIFRLRYEASVEYKTQKAEERELREIRRGNAWMRWSIAIVVVVVLMVVLLGFMAASIGQ